MRHDSDTLNAIVSLIKTALLAFVLSITSANAAVIETNKSILNYKCVGTSLEVTYWVDEWIRALKVRKVTLESA